MLSLANARIATVGCEARLSSNKRTSSPPHSFSSEEGHENVSHVRERRVLVHPRVALPHDADAGIVAVALLLRHALALPADDDGGRHLRDWAVRVPVQPHHELQRREALVGAVLGADAHRGGAARSERSVAPLLKANGRLKKILDGLYLP